MSSVWITTTFTIGNFTGSIVLARASNRTSIAPRLQKRDREKGGGSEAQHGTQITSHQQGGYHIPVWSSKESIGTALITTRRVGEVHVQSCVLELLLYLTQTNAHLHVYCYYDTVWRCLRPCDYPREYPPGLNIYTGTQGAGPVDLT